MVKAVVVGAAGGIGQPLSLLLKQSELITELALYDVVNAPGVAADVAHINTPATVTGYLPADGGLDRALAHADLVIIPAGVPRKPGMTRDDLFAVNAKICAGIASSIAANAPKAFTLVISNPVNSTVPIFAEVLKAKGVYDPRRLFGVTTLDVVRASTFVSEAAGKPLESLGWSVPVIGGHSGHTIVPLLSQSEPRAVRPLPPHFCLSSCTDPPQPLDQATIDKLTNRIQFGGDEVVKAKNGGGSATLSMAYAGARFAIAVLSAAKGIPQTEYTYVDLAADSTGGADVKKQLGADVTFFSVPVTLGPRGVEKILPLPPVSEYEQGLIKTAIKDLDGNVVKGVQFAAKL